MLRQGRIPDEDRRGQYYDVLVRESERLHRLVERLLSFGRADADRYRFEAVDARDLARAVAAEFVPHAKRRPVDLDVPDLPCPVRADREMLSRE